MTIEGNISYSGKKDVTKILKEIINDFSKKYDIVMTNKFVDSKMVDKSKLNLNFDFGYNLQDVEKSNVLIQLFYTEEEKENLEDYDEEMAQEEKELSYKDTLEEYNKIRSSKYNNLNIAVCPKDNFSLVLYLLFIKELTARLEGVAFYEGVPLNEDYEEFLEICSYKYIKKSIDKQIGIFKSEEFDADNDGSVLYEEAKWYINEEDEGPSVTINLRANKTKSSNFLWIIVAIIILVIFVFAIIIK